MNADPSELALAEPRPALAARLRESWVVRRWLLTRALTVFLLVPQVFEVLGDVRYYFHGVNRLVGAGTVGDTLPEYPAPSLVVFGLPRLLVGDHMWIYVPVFMALVLTFDAAFTWCLWRAAGRRPASGLTLWLWLLPALGPLTLCRLDLVPAVLAGGALLAMARRPALAGALVAAGAAVKLWPVVLVPALWLHRDPGRDDPVRGNPGRGDAGWGDAGWGDPGRGDPGRGDAGRGDAGRGDAGRAGRDSAGRDSAGRGDPGRRGGGARAGRWRMLAAFAVTGAAACLAVVALAGTDRLISPLTWQSDRSLQLESYAALPLLVAGVFSPGTWHVDYTRFLAFEVVGPGVPAMLRLATVGAVLAVALLSVLWLRAARRRDVPPPAAGWLATAAVALVVITDKTLSPQYLLWIGALLAAVGVWRGGSAESGAVGAGNVGPGNAGAGDVGPGAVGRGGAGPGAVDEAMPRATRLMLVAALLTQLFYPTMYGLLIDINPVAVAVIVARDVVLVRLTVLAVRRFWALTAAGRTG